MMFTEEGLLVMRSAKVRDAFAEEEGVSTGLDISVGFSIS